MLYFGMDQIYKQRNYLEIEKWIEQASKHKYSIGLISLPGWGVSFALKALVAKNGKFKYLVTTGEELGEFNILGS